MQGFPSDLISKVEVELQSNCRRIDLKDTSTNDLIGGVIKTSNQNNRTVYSYRTGGDFSLACYKPIDTEESMSDVVNRLVSKTGSQYTSGQIEGCLRRFDLAILKAYLMLLSTTDQGQ